MGRLTRFKREAARWCFHVLLFLSSLAVFLVYLPATTLHLQQLNPDAAPLLHPSASSGSPTCGGLSPVNASLSSWALAAPPSPPPSSPAEAEESPLRAPVDPRGGTPLIPPTAGYSDHNSSASSIRIEIRQLHRVLPIIQRICGNPISSPIVSTGGGVKVNADSKNFASFPRSSCS